MDAHDAMMNRRTAHQWVAEPLDDVVLKRALAAAHQAPCHKFTWPWRFTVVGPEARAKIVPIALALKERKRALSEPMRDKLRAKILNPGALIAVSVVRTDNDFQAREDYAATACAIQNMLLTATAEGLHGKWSTGGMTRADETYAVLGIDQAEQEIVGFVFLGRAECLPAVPRPAVDDFVRTVA